MRAATAAIAAGLLVGVACPAMADWACTMPNGVVIYKKISTCPADATHAQQITAAPTDVQAQFKGTYPAPRPPMPTKATTQRPPEQQAEQPKNIVDLAYLICQRMRTGGATSCDVKVNVFSPSYIDATLATDPKDAQRACLVIANWTRQPNSPFIGQGWTLKIYSPLGAGTRPMANCSL